MARFVFITGGARSGKSAFAQRLAEECDGPLLYVATAGVHDAEMAERVEKHRAARGDRWSLLEEPLDLAGRLPDSASGHGGILLDCVTLWVTNLYFHHGEDAEKVLKEIGRFAALMHSIEVPLFLVSNEIGMGVVPENRLARAFRDLAGEANQILAAVANEAWLVASGLPVRLK